MKYIPALLAVLAIGGTDDATVPPLPSGIQAQSVPPLTEASWSFTDNGTTYFVGKQTGRIVILRSDQTPEPAPQPAPVPPPVPNVEKAAWISLIVDPADSQAATYRTDPQARSSISRAGIEFRTYVATERDIETLGFRSIVTEQGLPTVILQDKTGKVISSRRIKDSMDWTLFYTGINP